MNTLERQYGTLFSYEEGTFFEKLRKDEKEMKKVKIFLGAFLCMNFLTMSGCDKVVYSAVVEEKDKTDSKTEEHKEKETVQKTVAEQVQAPEKYQTIIQSDLRTAERTDQKNPMKFTLTANAPVEVPDVDAICLKNVKKVAISEEEPQKVLDTFVKGQLLKQNDDGLVETYEVNGLTYQYTGTFQNLEVLSLWEKYSAFDDVKEENLSQDEKEQRAERFQNYIKAGNQNMTEEDAENYVKDIVSGEWCLFDSASKELTEENSTLEKDTFFFERMVNGVPVNYIRNSYLPYDELSRPWIDEDDNFHESQCKGWDNESLTMVFCSGTLQSFDHSDPIEVSDASDEAVFLLPFDEIKDIFEKTITMQIMTEQENRLLAVDGTSFFARYPSIDAQTVEMTITKVQLGYMRVREGNSNTEGSLIPVWDFYGTWNSQEPVAYTDSGDEMVIDSVTMDRIGVPLLTIDARDGSVVQRVQGGSSTTFPGGIGECE